MTETENLCTSCGLCCDGTLYREVNLNSDDEQSRLLALGAEIKPAPGNPQKPFAMSLGCKAHVDGLCTIFGERPTDCGKFECALLRTMRKGEKSLHEAKRIVAETKHYRDALRQAAEISAPEKADLPILDLRNFAISLFDKDVAPEDRVTHGSMIIEATALNVMMYDYFHSPTNEE